MQTTKRVRHEEVLPSLEDSSRWRLVRRLFFKFIFASLLRYCPCSPINWIKNHPDVNALHPSVGCPCRAPAQFRRCACVPFNSLCACAWCRAAFSVSVPGECHRKMTTAEDRYRLPWSSSLSTTGDAREENSLESRR